MRLVLVQWTLDVLLLSTVYRMWGGMVALKEIEAGLKEIKNGCR